LTLFYSSAPSALIGASWPRDRGPVQWVRSVAGANLAPGVQGLVSVAVFAVIGFVLGSESGTRSTRSALVLSKQILESLVNVAIWALFFR
jgi:hypothetical protein